MNIKIEELRSKYDELRSKFTIRELDQIKQKECLQVYRPIMENALDQLSVAELLANGEHYGSAITHSILGAEEMTKSLVVFLNGKKINLQAVKGYKGIIQSHLPRHTFANMIAMMAFMVEPMIIMFKRLKTEDIHPKDLIDQILNDVNPKLEEQVNAMSFWFMADTMKNKGHYVDFRNHLIKPKDLSKEEFESTMRSCLKHVNLCMSIIDIVETTAEESLKYWQKKSNTKEFRELMSLFFTQ